MVDLVVFSPVGIDVFSDGDDWDMVYRGTAGIGESAYDAYMNPQTGCVQQTCLDVRLQYNSVLYFLTILIHFIVGHKEISSK